MTAKEIKELTQEELDLVREVVMNRYVFKKGDHIFYKGDLIHTRAVKTGIIGKASKGFRLVMYTSNLYINTLTNQTKLHVYQADQDGNRIPINYDELIGVI